MGLVGTGRWRRKWSALALVALLAALCCVCWIDQTSAYKRGAVPIDNDDDDDEEDDDEFDFMSTKITAPRTTPSNAFTCDDAGAGECVAPTTPSVVARGLVTTRPRVLDVLREHTRTASDASISSAFAGETLGYVTPWNARGYDFARTYRHKFTFLAPVWLQIREDGKTKQPVVTGTHDIDRAWVRDVRGNRDGGSKAPKVVPRVMYERNRLADDDVPVIIAQLLALATRESLDGFVFEIPITRGTMDILLRLGRAFHDAKLLLLLVISRSSNHGQLPVTQEMLDELRPLVHRFTMNAYDYETPGPNAPLTWIRATIENFRAEDRAKILMGLPFYGYDNSDAIVGATYIEQLKQHDVIKIRWDAVAHECVHHYVADSARHTVYFPCLQFLQDRLELFQQAGLAGTAVWELGQGLEYFYDLL